MSLISVLHGSNLKKLLGLFRFSLPQQILNSKTIVYNDTE